MKDKASQNKGSITLAHTGDHPFTNIHVEKKCRVVRRHLYPSLAFEGILLLHLLGS